MQRPAGLTVLAIIHFIIAALMLLSGILWILAADLLRSGAVSGETGLPVDVSHEMELLLRLGPAAGVLFIVYAVLKGVSGYGLLKLRNWARWLTLALAALTVGVTLPGLLSALAQANYLETAFNLVFVAGYAAIIGYLFTPAIRRAFGAGEREPQSSAPA